MIIIFLIYEIIWKFSACLIIETKTDTNLDRMQVRGVVFYSFLSFSSNSKHLPLL